MVGVGHDFCPASANLELMARTTPYPPENESRENVLGSFGQLQFSNVPNLLDATQNRINNDQIRCFF